MSRFLANIIDQMDLALDNLAIDDVSYKRFSLMLVDNAVELMLHEFAKDKSKENRMWGSFGASPNDPKLVSAALGQYFEPKVKLARTANLVTQEIGDTIVILHSFRNQVYHQGLQHEGILAAIAIFYFRVACTVLAACEPNWLSWGSNQGIPYRARSCLGNSPFVDRKGMCKSAFLRFEEESRGFSLTLAEDLSAHMEQTIDYTDDAIDFLSSNSPEPKDRDQVIIDCQAWPFAFTDEGKAIARKNGSPAKTVSDHVEWIAQNHPWPINKDPIQSWRRRLVSLRLEKEEHRALKKYRDFMDQTESIREQINEAAEHLDQHIMTQIDRARGK